MLARHQLIAHVAFPLRLLGRVGDLRRLVGREHATIELIAAPRLRKLIAAGFGEARPHLMETIFSSVGAGSIFWAFAVSSTVFPVGSRICPRNAPSKERIPVSIAVI